MGGRRPSPGGVGVVANPESGEPIDLDPAGRRARHTQYERERARRRRFEAWRDHKCTRCFKTAVEPPNMLCPRCQKYLRVAGARKRQTKTGTQGLNAKTRRVVDDLMHLADDE